MAAVGELVRSTTGQWMVRPLPGRWCFSDTVGASLVPSKFCAGAPLDE